MKNKIFFYLVVLLLLSLVPITVFGDTQLSVVLANKIEFVRTIQRLLGLTAFTLMFVQIMIGAYMEKWTEKLGGWIFQYHIAEGIVIYCLVILHPIMFVVYNYFTLHTIDPVYVFLGFCLLCHPMIEYYYTLGRVAFWLLTIGVSAGLFRASTPFLRVHWRKFHVLNYLVFLIIGIHGLSIGTDFMMMPFFPFAILAYVIVLYTVIRKIPHVIEVYKNWVSS